MLLALNLKGDWASYGSVAITLLFVIGCIIATRLINRIGRRCMLLHSFLWSGLALLGLGVFHAGSEATILGLFGAYALFIGGAQVLQLVYPNELFPPRSAPSRSASAPRYRASAPRWAPTWCRFPWKPWVPPRPCTPPRW